MVPNARPTLDVVATHELVWSPGVSRSRPPEGAQPAKAGTPNTARFMVTIHARKRVCALPEAVHGRDRSPSRSAFYSSRVLRLVPGTPPRFAQPTRFLRTSHKGLLVNSLNATR